MKKYTPLAKCVRNQIILEAIQVQGCLLQVPDSTVNKLRAATRSAAREVISLDKSDLQSPRSSIQSNPTAGCAASNHKNVVHIRFQLMQNLSASRDTDLVARGGRPAFSKAARGQFEFLPLT